MTPGEAKRFVIPAIAGAGVLAALSDLETLQLPRLRIAIGGFLVAIVLTALAGPAPELAAGIAALIFVSALLAKGGVIDKISEILA